ncbi:hypothetical protein BS50DRAFT_619993 [Corynespora cassiicola Philippines]|uniref:1-alkyl-2-acetylglycerophosphocholine esterase n=1 Tax=Corynespora cassiicola Philippines TaxID=1448308 RepID=A0A2T2NVB1_CORCC|nr:hypothetical protein BS50DRAFT_619993 [Corynespora cassiicola Philippines]
MTISLGAFRLSFFIGVCSCLLLPPPTGTYHVGSKAHVLNKTTINDPVAPSGTGTSILINFYYPTLRKSVEREYIWKGLSSLYEEYYNLPKDSFGRIKARIGHDAPPLSPTTCEHLNLPTLIWGPPFAGPPSQLFLGLFSELVSRGYTIVTVDHPYEQPFLQYPNGTGIQGLAMDFYPGNPEVFLNQVVNYRLDDNAVLLRNLPELSEKTGISLNLTHFAIFGHSIGGAVAPLQILYEKALRNTSRETSHFIGAINLDGGMFGAAISNNSFSDTGVPNLLMASQGHQHDMDPTWPTFEAWQSAWTTDVRVLGNSNHTDYSDLIVLKQANGVAGGRNTIQANRMIDLVRIFVRTFFDMVGGRIGGEGILSGSKQARIDWPEVVWQFQRD